MRSSQFDPFVSIDLPLPDRRDGKVRSSWSCGDERRLIVTTDRLSAFDRVLAGVPFKGQVLNELAAWWFEQLDHIVAHHLLDVPDPNAMLVRSATPLPVEVVVRQYITGVTDTSLWGMYSAGQREMYGHRLPDGLTKNAELPDAIITPTTKALDGGHDEPLSVAQVVERGLVDATLWEQVQRAALSVFDRGRQLGERAGLILADTKYEFGIDRDGRLVLIDEVHTPDSSRWWIADSFAERIASGDEPESLDKEVVRRAYADLGYRGQGDPPPIADDVWEATSARYIDAFERLTGRAFTPGYYPVPPRLTAHLTEAGLI